MTERAVVLDSTGFAWSAGSPEPVVHASEHRHLVAYYRNEAEADGDDEVQLVELVRCVAMKSGPPNDEAMHGHRLWGHGLEHYALHEVMDSTWLAELRRMAGVHPRAVKVPYPTARHFVLAFHDSTIEAVAEEVRPISTHRTLRDAALAMIEAASA